MQTTKDSSQQIRNQQLDFLKLLACLAVIGLHIHIKYDSIPFRFMYYLCSFGVPSFFMCTGYLILDRPSFSSHYIVKKLIAILRVALLWSIVAAFLKLGGQFLQNGTPSENLFVSIFHILYLGLQDQGIMFVLWYLGALFLIYLSLPFVHMFLTLGHDHPSRKRMAILWGFLVVAILCARLYSLHIGRMLQNRIWLTYRIWTYWQYMLLGAQLKVLQPKICRRISLPVHILVTIIFSILAAAEFVWIKTCLIENAWASTSYDSIALILWTSALFTLILRLRFSEKVSTSIAFFTSLTMGVYLVHPLIMEVFGLFFEISGPVMTEIYYLAVIVLAFLAAWILKKLPFGRFFTQL